MVDKLNSVLFFSRQFKHHNSTLSEHFINPASVNLSSNFRLLELLLFFVAQLWILWFIVLCMEEFPLVSWAILGGRAKLPSTFSLLLDHTLSTSEYSCQIHYSVFTPRRLYLGGPPRYFNSRQSILPILACFLFLVSSVRERRHPRSIN